MSAIRITAEPGRLYLTYSGRRLRVVRVGAHHVEYHDLDDNPTFPLFAPRSLFESAIESVIE